MAQITRHRPGPRITAGVVHNSTVYLAGQLDTTTDDAYDQTVRTLKKVDELLAECGSRKDAVLHATVHLAHVEDSAAMNKAWDEWVADGAAPARVTVQAPLVRPEARVEITIIAAQTD
ncbi:RidA family protein [Streptomyces sp. NPDC058045]|uniref:RidA family protein n=1 Tax=Streptomyces sp. NPDC058045 TaxID=3346311 RepID=UPI0036DFEA32